MYGMRTYLKKADIMTLLNVALGVCAVVFLLNGNSDIAARLILLGVIADGFDGYIARKMETESEFGMNLDSLSDVITFGMAPALLVYFYIFSWWIIPVSVIYVCCGVLRLARYNVSSKDLEEGTFIGIPIPLAALFMVLSVFGSLPGVAVAALVLLISCLMVCSINFAKITTTHFPAHNLALLIPVAVPEAYIVPFARIAFMGCAAGVILRRRRKNNYL